MFVLLQGINKRFQRLESHVVTLARSVAHLSSEMRTQHLMIQVSSTFVAKLKSIFKSVTLCLVMKLNQKLENILIENISASYSKNQTCALTNIFFQVFIYLLASDNRG